MLSLCQSFLQTEHVGIFLRNPILKLSNIHFHALLLLLRCPPFSFPRFKSGFSIVKIVGQAFDFLSILNGRRLIFRFHLFQDAFQMPYFLILDAIYLKLLLQGPCNKFELALHGSLHFSLDLLSHCSL